MNLISFFKIIFNYPDDEIVKRLKALNDISSKRYDFKDRKFIFERNGINSSWKY
jgi:hypothetical protein